MGEGRQALDVNSEQARERVGLGVTELRELGRDVLDRAVSLAQLHAGQGGARSDGPGGGGEAVGGQRHREGVRTCRDVVPGFGELGRTALFQLGDALASELAHRIGTGSLRKEAERRGGHVVVVAVHADVTGLGQDVGAGGASASAPERGGGLMLLDRALLDEQVEVTADRGGGQPQAGGEGGRGERAILGDRLADPVPGARLENVRSGVGPLCTIGDGVVADKHKDIVT